MSEPWSVGLEKYPEGDPRWHGQSPGPVCHIRDEDHLSFCGNRGESVSIRHLREHVIPNKDGCCGPLHSRLCAMCLRALDFTEKNA